MDAVQGDRILLGRSAKLHVGRESRLPQRLSLLFISNLGMPDRIQPRKT
jgi:hypothetical protein